MSENVDLPISERLLEILRDPVAVQDKETYGDDPGRLELVHNCWLVSVDTGYKYPIKDGIPVMLVEEGEKWQNTHIDDLPVPPPAMLPESLTGPQIGDHTQAVTTSSGPDPIVLLGMAVIGFTILFVLVKLFSPKKSS
ncbi:MAG: hypothetical protein AAF629_07500 [Chloroflexota bacterium]